MSLKIADVFPVHKKDEKTLLKNYRPISLIPLVSKLFERNMYNQISQYINTFLSPCLFGYRQGYSTEQCIVIMNEAWKKALDNKRYAGAILTDLSKAFDCLNHDLLIAKLKAYLKNRKQRTQVNGSYSSWREAKNGIPQGSFWTLFIQHFYE